MRVLLLGGTSEIGLAILSALHLAPDAEVILAGRDPQRLEAAGKSLNRLVTVVRYDALDSATHQAFADQVCAGGVPDLVIAATGVLTPQERLQQDVQLAATMITTNFTGHVTVLLAFGEAMRRRALAPDGKERHRIGRGARRYLPGGRPPVPPGSSGTIVVLSSIAAVRPRKFNSVYGATKAALDSFARGYADSLHGSGVRVLLVRPGFVTGRMTRGMKPAPLATTPEGVGAAVARAVQGGKSVVWVPASLAGLAAAAKLVPRPVWRKLES